MSTMDRRDDCFRHVWIDEMSFLSETEGLRPDRNHKGDDACSHALKPRVGLLTHSEYARAAAILSGCVPWPEPDVADAPLSLTVYQKLTLSLFCWTLTSSKSSIWADQST
jgi:hypothetical protein